MILKVKQILKVEEHYNDYTTYIKYYRKKFNTTDDLNNYINKLKKDSLESVDGWELTFFVKMENDKNYKMI